MNLRTYSLTDEQKAKLVKGVTASLSLPIVDSLEDFIWEAVFCYTTGVQLFDPLFAKRSKLLFDVVDDQNNIGWSAKSLQWSVRENVEFELVIQRADVFKKRDELGFPNLDRNSPPDTIGSALLEHWHRKINNDAQIQNVTDKRVCILLKTANNDKFAYFEEELAIYSPNDLNWRWTNNTKTGLQGIRKSDNFCVYRWYPNQKQFFERFKLYDDAYIFDASIVRLPLDEVIEMLHSRIQDIQESSEQDDT